MKTRRTKQEEQNICRVDFYFNGVPITIQSSDLFRLRMFLAQISVALTDSADYYRSNNMLDLASAQDDLKSIVHNARCNIVVL